MRFHIRLASLCGLVAVVPSLHCVAAPLYAIRPMGSGTTNVQDLNDLGRAVGFVDSGSTRRAWVWQDGVYTLLPNPGGSSSATGINSAGDVAGMSGRAGYWRGSDHRFITFAVEGMAHVINDRGQAAGIVFNNGAQESFFYDPDQGLRIIAPASSHGVNTATDINNAGIVVGAMNFSGYRWDAARGLVGVNGLAAGINDRGQIVGASGNQPVLWEADGTRRTLGLPPDGTGGAAREINEAGQVVGHFTGGRRGGAFLWDKGDAYELLDIVVNPAGWTSLSYAVSINDAGQIVGEGHHESGWQGFIMTPVPEPGATGGALILMTCLLRRSGRFPLRYT